jgi:hypothetical protein
MDDAQRLPVLVRARVGMVKRSRDLSTHVQNEGVRKLRDAFRHDVRQGVEGVPINALDDDVNRALDPLDAVDMSDPRVAQIRGEFDLLFEPRSGLIRVICGPFWKADALEDHIRAGSFNRSPAREQHGLAVIASFQRHDELVASLSG